MKKIISLVTAAMLLLVCSGSAAAQGQQAPDYIMEGFDGENTGRHWEENLFFARMEERTGISFEFREFTQLSAWKARKEGLQEKTNLPDVLFKADLDAGEIRDLYAAGVLIDLKPYLADYAPDLWKLLQEDPVLSAAVTLPDGAIPALPAINRLQNNDVMWINTKWLQRVKKEMPTDAASLKDVLTAFRDGDPNSNGRKDETPLTFVSMWELRFLGHAFGITDNDYYISVRDGQVVSSLTSDENRAFLTWLHELWTENLLDHNGFGMADALRQITDEKTAIPYGLIMSYTPMTVVPSSALNQYELLMPMEYEGNRTYRDMTGDVIRGTFAITSRCAEPEKLVSWVNYLYTEEGAMMALYGLEDEEYSFREDGTWEWNYDLATVGQTVLAEKTMGTGTPAPGITPAEFQTLYSDSNASSDIKQLISFKQYTVLPYPLVTLSKEDETAIAGIQKELSAYAETAMARFVTGDIPLNDEEWENFCAAVEDKGLSSMIGIWQKYIR